jgi:hypothetical protein
MATMATVTPVPFALALLGALAVFSVWMWFLVRESRRPYHWPQPRRIAAPPPARPARAHLRAVHTATDEVAPPHKIRGARVAIVVATFLLWSLWSTGRPDRADMHH